MDGQALMTSGANILPAPDTIPASLPGVSSLDSAGGAESSPVFFSTNTIWCGVIPGEPMSKANSRRMVNFKSREGKKYLASVKSCKALAYMEAAIAELTILRPREPYLGNLVMDCVIWYASRRPDLDESLVMDVLQRAAIIKNDRQIREKHVYWRLDPLKPRALVSLSRLVEP
jgi:Holliday junction resolvase RusA-like endonuclease